MEKVCAYQVGKETHRRWAKRRSKQQQISNEYFNIPETGMKITTIIR